MGFYPDIRNFQPASMLLAGMQLAEKKREREQEAQTLAAAVKKQQAEQEREAINQARDFAHTIDDETWPQFKAWVTQKAPSYAGMLPEWEKMTQADRTVWKAQFAKGKDYEAKPFTPMSREEQIAFERDKAQARSTPNYQTFYDPSGVPHTIDVARDAPGNDWTEDKPKGVEFYEETVYGPEGRTMKVSVPKGKGYAPPEGWSLNKEEAGVSKDAATLRKEFIQGSKTFVDVRDSYARIQASTKEPSAAGDLALIFNYMKMLDPSSVVREGEFATAANAGGVPDRARATYNKVLSGKRLSEKQRQDFLNRSDKLYDAQLETHEKLVSEYSRLAEDYGIEPPHVIVDYVLQQSGNLPPNMAAQIGEGEKVTFANGQVWTKQNGAVRRIQ